MRSWSIWEPSLQAIADGGHAPIVSPRASFRNLVEDIRPGTKSFHDLGIPKKNFEIVLGHPVKFCDFMLDIQFGVLMVQPDLWIKVEPLLQNNVVNPVEILVRQEKSTKQRPYIVANIKYKNVLAGDTDFLHSSFYRADNLALRNFRLGKMEKPPFEKNIFKFKSFAEYGNENKKPENWMASFIPKPLVLKNLRFPHLCHFGNDWIMSSELVEILGDYQATGYHALPSLFEIRE